MRVTVKKPGENHIAEEKTFYLSDCEECGKEIAFTKADITLGAQGCVMVYCPCLSV